MPYIAFISVATGALQCIQCEYTHTYAMPYGKTYMHVSLSLYEVVRAHRDVHETAEPA